MDTRQLCALWLGAALLTATCGCGGSGGGGGFVGGGDSVWPECIAVRAADPTGLQTTDLTPGASSNYEYIAFSGTDITLFAWRSNLPPPLESAPILFRSNRDGNHEVYVMDADGTDPVRLTDNPAWDRDPCWSPDGTEVAFSSNRDGNDEIYLMNADGSSPVNLTNYSGDDKYPSWSPDGSRIAFSSRGVGETYYELCVMDPDGSNLVNLTNTSDASELYPSWSPDSGKIAFVYYPSAPDEIRVMNADGSNPITLLTGGWDKYSPSWSPDGAKIAFQYYIWDGGAGQYQYEVYLMNADGSSKVNLSNNAASDGKPCWSPDGSKIAFTSKRDGEYRIYVMNPDGTDQVPLVAYPSATGSDACWTLWGSFRCLVGYSGRDGGYDPTLGEERSAVIAVFDENSLPGAVGITVAGSGIATVERPDPVSALPTADVCGDAILRVMEDAGRGRPPIRHIAITDALIEGWVYRALIIFRRDTARVASVIAFRGELRSPDRPYEWRESGSEVLVRGYGMHLAVGDGRLADAPVSEIRLDAQSGEVVSAQ